MGPGQFWLKGELSVLHAHPSPTCRVISSLGPSPNTFASNNKGNTASSTQIQYLVLLSQKLSILPGIPQGRWSLVACHLWGRTESDTTEVT